MMIHKGQKYLCTKDVTIYEVREGESYPYQFKAGSIYRSDEDNSLLIEGECVSITPDVGDTTFREEQVDHPFHYNHDNPVIGVDNNGRIESYPIECIDVIRNMPTWKGNAIKYLWRAGLKQEVGKSDVAKEIEDLEKAKWYIDDRIKQLKASQQA